MRGRVLLIAVLLVAVMSALVLRSLWSPGSQPKDDNQSSYGDGDVRVTFEVTVPEVTPEEDRVYLRIEGFWYDGREDIPMEPTGQNTWTVVFMTDPNSQLRYKYNRNNYGFATDEEFTPDSDQTWRTAAVGTQEQTIRDAVPKWRWLSNDHIEVELSSFEPAELPPRQEPFAFGVFPLDFYNEAFTELVPATFDRMKEKGFEYVGLAYAPSFFTSSKPLTFTHDPVNTYSQEELELAVAEARKRGLKILIAAGIETDPSYFESVEGEFSKRQSDEWYVQLAQEWEESMVRTAEFAEEHGIEIFTPSNQWPFWGDMTEEQERTVNDLVNQAFEAIRSVYSGKISSDYYVESETFDYYKQMDWVGDKWWWALADDRATTVEGMKDEAERLIDEIYEPIYERYGKPILLQQLAYSSYDGAAGAVEIGIEGPEVAEWFPYNPLYPADFQEQADAYEAVLQAIHDETIFTGVFSFSYTYWDSQDKSPGIRGKPAEDVWARWAAIWSQD
jgi:hypothetical protein